MSICCLLSINLIVGSVTENYKKSENSSSSSFLLPCEVKVVQLCPTLCDPMDYTVHGILQAGILEWVAFPFSRGFSQPRDQAQASCIAGGFYIGRATREALLSGCGDETAHLCLITFEINDHKFEVSHLTGRVHVIFSSSVQLLQFSSVQFSRV